MVPSELEAEVRANYPDAQEVAVNLVDKTKEVYNAPKPKFDFTQSGTGTTLGGYCIAALRSSSNSRF